MQNRTILYVMNSATPDKEIAQLAETAARDKTHLLCLLADPAPVLPMYAYGVPPYGGMNIPDNWTETVEATQKEHRKRINEVEKILAQHQASGDVIGALAASTEVKYHVAHAARVSDEAIFAPNLRDSPDVMREAASGILFQSPIGFLLNAAPSGTYERVFIAWDSSTAASAAVHAALPHLKAASEVVVGCIDPVLTTDRDGADAGTDVGAWLSHHGCNVTVSQYPSGGHDIGKCIQDRASEVGADLIVMGAYGHARMVQTVLGGTTRSMVEQTERAVLLAH